MSPRKEPGRFSAWRFGATPEDLRLLPVWQELERRFHLELAQALSSRGRRGRESDFRDAERSVRSYAADELSLSFVPDPEQRLWRTLARTKQRWCREKSRLPGGSPAGGNGSNCRALSAIFWE